MTHIRVGVVRSSRGRLYQPAGSPGTTLCGAPATPDDVTASEARSIDPANLERLKVCPACWAARPPHWRAVR